VGTTSIRPITAGDKPAVMGILHNTPEFLPHEITVAEELIDCYLDDPPSSGYHIYVAEVSGSIGGYICYGLTPLTDGTWDIFWIVVAHEKQGHGIGHILMKHAEDDIKRMGGRLVIVETSGKPEYNKTRWFYDTLNYQNICQIPDFYAPGDDLVIFIKRLR
jgi:GNAT superfamily N-acetyltransferase